MFSWIHLSLILCHLSIFDLLITHIPTETPCYWSILRLVHRYITATPSKVILSSPTGLRGLVGRGGGLCFEVSLCVLLGGEGGRGAAARWRGPGLRGFKGQIEVRASPRHPDVLPLELLRRQTLHVLIPERERGRIRGGKDRVGDNAASVFQQCCSQCCQITLN